MTDQETPNATRTSVFLEVLLELKWHVLVVVLAASATAVVVALALPPTFRVDAVLSPATNEASTAGGLSQLISRYSDVASLAGVSLPSGSADEYEAVATLSSRALLQSFILDNNLLPLLFPEAWEPTTNSWKTPEKAPTVWHGIRELQSRVMTVSTDRRTGLVTLTIDWRDPQVAADWAAQLIARTNETLRARAIEEGQSSIEHLNAEISRTNEVQLRAAIYRLMESQLWRVTMATVTREYAFRVIDPPMPPAERFRPNRAQIALTGLMMGFVLAMGLVVFRANSRFRE